MRPAHLRRAPYDLCAASNLLQASTLCRLLERQQWAAATELITAELRVQGLLKRL